MKTLAELEHVYRLPLPELIFRALEVHRRHHDAADIQRCALLSVKTGGCPEDCGYCAQSARYQTDVKATPLLSVAEVRERATRAQQLGATRFCMGTAWREVKDGPQFDDVLDMVRVVRALGMEACVTLGMLTGDQARRLADAGLTAYNHNLDTSRRHYPKVIGTRSYDDRLRTLSAVSKAGIAVCCGGILGMGESEEDRLMLLAELAQLDPPPESIPINSLVPIAGTPLESAAPVEPLELVRLVATTRLAFPKARVRLSAGRDRMSVELQTLCFLAGANSIFFGDKLLTAPNPPADGDAALFKALGLPVLSAAPHTRFQPHGLGPARVSQGPIVSPATEDVRAGHRPCGQTVMALDERWRRFLNEAHAQARLRELALPAGIDFSSNDYLGYGRLAERPGTPLPRSGTASRLLRGHHELWDNVETLLAAWHGAEAALMFTSGYVANEGLLATVIGPEDFVASDAANHASIIDGLRLTKAQRFVFRHNDLAHLEDGLRAARREPRPGREAFIVTESLFGMAGDRAPLGEIVALAERSGAHVIVDEAHATGCFGPRGSGIVDELGLRGGVLATVHTGGKALGVAGAYVVGARLLKDYLVNRCRRLIYTTALPPQIAAWWLETIPRVQADDAGRQSLHGNTRRFRAALRQEGVTAAGEHFIVPVVIGADARAVAAARQLQEQGYDIRALRPPTVPEGTARLRISVHADHDGAVLDDSARCVAECRREFV